MSRSNPLLSAKFFWRSKKLLDKGVSLLSRDLVKEEEEQLMEERKKRKDDKKKKEAAQKKVMCI